MIPLSIWVGAMRQQEKSKLLFNTKNALIYLSELQYGPSFLDFSNIHENHSKNWEDKKKKSTKTCFLFCF